MKYNNTINLLSLQMYGQVHKLGAGASLLNLTVHTINKRFQRINIVLGNAPLKMNTFRRIHRKYRMGAIGLSA